MEAYREFMRLFDSNNEDQITQELCDTMVQEIFWPISLELIPYRFKTRNLCMKYLESKPYDYDAVPKELMDKEMWAHVFKHDGTLINRGNIPDEIVNQEMYEIAVVHGGLQIQRVPCKYRNIIVCRHAFNKCGFDHIKGYMPDSIKKNKLYYLDLVSIHGKFLKYVLLEDRTFDICKAAIENYPYAIRYVPEHLKNKFSNVPMLHI